MHLLTMVLIICKLLGFTFTDFFIYLPYYLLSKVIYKQVNNHPELPVKMSITSTRGTFFTNKYAELGLAMVHHCSACSRTFSFGWRGRSINDIFPKQLQLLTLSQNTTQFCVNLLLNIKHKITLINFPKHLIQFDLG